MAEVEGADARDKVEVALPLGIPDLRARRAYHDHRRADMQSLGHEAVAQRAHFLTARPRLCLDERAHRATPIRSSIRARISCSSSAAPSAPARSRPARPNSRASSTTTVMADRWNIPPPARRADSATVNWPA